MSVEGDFCDYDSARSIEGGQHNGRSDPPHLSWAQWAWWVVMILLAMGLIAAIDIAKSR